MCDAYGLCKPCRSLDRDGSGRITITELQEALASLGVPVDADIAGKMVELIDVDGSSDISFQEFRRFAVLLPQSQASMTPKLYSQTHWHVLRSQCGALLAAQASKADLSYQVWHPYGLNFFPSPAQAVSLCAVRLVRVISHLLMHRRSRMPGSCWTGWTAPRGWTEWSTGWEEFPPGSPCSGLWRAVLLAPSPAQVNQHNCCKHFSDVEPHGAVHCSWDACRIMSNVYA